MGWATGSQYRTDTNVGVSAKRRRAEDTYRRKNREITVRETRGRKETAGLWICTAGNR